MEAINISENKEKKSSKVLITILGILLSIYLIGSLVFLFITLPNTYINGKDVSYASKASVLDESVDNFDVTIEGRDKRELKFNVSQIDYDAKLPKDASINQNPFTWPLAFLNLTDNNFDLDYKVKYDEEKLDEIINSSKIMQDIVKPENAKVEYRDGDFEVIKEIEGNEISFRDFKKEVLNIIYKRIEEKVVLDDSLYSKPKIRANDDIIKEELEIFNKIKDLSYDFNINGYDDKLEGETLIEMFDTEDGSLELNYDKIYAYVSDIANKTDTYGTIRQFDATGIGEISVNPGVYGFILDVAKTVDNVYDLVDKRQAGTIEPVYEKYAYSREEDGSDIGGTYIEVDLSRQYLWYYKDYSLIFETPFVSGNIYQGFPTNVGVGAILMKERDAKLKGEDFDGSQYETPVKYWMPIGWDGEGFHDASWRGAFGGDIYYSAGSHGCINLPPAIAKRIFEEVDYLTPVVVYESSTDFSPEMSY